jgi:hypothetical protein
VKWKWFHLTALVLWGTAGAFFTFLLRDSVAWVNFMSWYAIEVTHFTGWRADSMTDEEARKIARFVVELMKEEDVA